MDIFPFIQALAMSSLDAKEPWILLFSYPQCLIQCLSFSKHSTVLKECLKKIIIIVCQWLKAKTSRNILVIVQGRFIMCCSKREHTLEENIRYFCKRVLEIIYYRIWAPVGWCGGGGSKEVGVSRRLHAVRQWGNSVTVYFNES